MSVDVEKRSRVESEIELGDGVPCETTHGECANEVRWLVTLRCCRREFKLCDRHLESYLKWERDTDANTSMIRICGLCDTDNPPPCDWRAI